jgi:RNA recognition motif-containing protein
MKIFQTTFFGLMAAAATLTTTSAFSMSPSSRLSVSLMMSEDPVAVEEAPVATEEPEKHTVYVGNLPFSSTQRQIQDLFSDQGINVLNVAMPMNQNMIDEVTGLPKSKGFCFVDVESEEMIVSAVTAFNDMNMDGRSMRVNKLLPKEEVEERQNKREKNYTPDGTYAILLPVI